MWLVLVRPHYAPDDSLPRLDQSSTEDSTVDTKTLVTSPLSHRPPWVVHGNVQWNFNRSRLPLPVRRLSNLSSTSLIYYTLPEFRISKLVFVSDSFFWLLELYCTQNPPMTFIGPRSVTFVSPRLWIVFSPGVSVVASSKDLECHLRTVPSESSPEWLTVGE